ncbi:hypothetical protein GH714_009528 [Hevea brasiliensis]|uniref:Uncharacterized protein n=1 Tax=Hevea brasiliensis TaxID=3981 RepID=A0A6A6L237_HEVBR|nr:hypothetical protein GH714_009528 [Hevea brasiliensis]
MQIVGALEGYICIEEIRNEKNDNIFPKVISLFGTSFAFPTGIDSTLSNGAQGPDPSFLDPTPTNGRNYPPDARLPNGGGQVQSICAELKSVEGYMLISAFGTSFAFPTGIDSTLSNGTQGQDPTPINGRDDPPDARLPNGGGQVQSISAESESVDGKESRSLNDGENGVTQGIQH